MTWYWIAWFVLGFCVPEGVALFNKTKGDTLSETVWAWLRGKERTEPETTTGRHAMAPAKPQPITWNHNTWRTWVVGSFLLWLFLHLTFGWFSG